MTWRPERRCVIEDPTVVEPTEAVIRLTATCICGSGLWPYRGIQPVEEPMPIGHEYVGVVEEVGADVTSVAPGDYVVGSFVASDTTCEICAAGYQSRCVHTLMMGEVGTQAERARVPLADGTLVKVPQEPTEAQLRSLLAASDVLGTGWFATVAAEAGPGKAVAAGTQESMMQAIHACRPGGHVGYVGVAHEVELNGMELFFSGVHLHGGPPR